MMSGRNAGQAERNLFIQADQRISLFSCGTDARGSVDVACNIINNYNMPVDQGDDTIACEDTILAPKPFDENGWEDIDHECLNNSFMINVQITECYISGTMPNE